MPAAQVFMKRRKMQMLRGSCLCGAVCYQVTGDVYGPSVCHCSQCRKQSGHLWASAYVAGKGDYYEISDDLFQHGK